MPFEYKNSKLTNELFDSAQIKFATWIYDRENDCYFDVVLSDRILAIVGNDLIDEYILSKISNCGAYFGVDDEDYDYNLWDDDSIDWVYGDGEILIFFADSSGKRFGITFQQARFSDARRFYIELHNFIGSNYVANAKKYIKQF